MSLLRTQLLLPATVLVLACSLPPALACSRPFVMIGDSGAEDTTPSGDEEQEETEKEEVPGYPEDTSPPEQVPGMEYEHLGVLLLDTFGQSIPDDDKIDAWLEVVREHDNSLTDLDSAGRTWDGPVGVEIHGSSATGFAKLSYRIEFRDDSGEDLDYPLLGMASASDFTLHGPYSDKTLIRNALAYRLGNAIAEDTDEWQPGTRFAELFINEGYAGVYVVTERVMRDEDRLDLPVLPASSAEGDITGGYIFKVDGCRGDCFTTAYGTYIDYVYPRYAAITSEQDSYLRSYLDSFEAALYADNWADPATGYPTWMATDSFIDHFIINELSLNVDAYRLSGYLYKEADADGGLLHAGPLWDFNLAFGNVNYCECYITDGWIYDGLVSCGGSSYIPFWWQRLLQDPNYTAQLRCRWEELRDDELSDARIEDHIRELAEEVAGVEPRDHTHWQNLGVYVWPNYYIGVSWEDELDYLTGWTLEHARWLDSNMPGTCAHGQ